MSEGVLINCGYNGCVYDNGDTVIKKANGKLSVAAREIQFGKFVKGHEGELALILLLSYKEAGGLINIPEPPGLENWKPKHKQDWLKRNRGKDKIHHCLIYPKLDYTFSDVYWTLSKIERYKTCIRFLKTLMVMADNNYYNPDIHAENIMFGNNSWYMIDYGYIRRKSTHYWRSVLGCLLTFSSIPGYEMYPADHKPNYNKFADILKTFKKEAVYERVEKLARTLSDLSPHAKNDIMLEILWYLDYNTAANITGFTKWMSIQPENIKKRFSRPHNFGIENEDMIYCLCRITNVKLIIRRLRTKLKKLEQL